MTDRNLTALTYHAVTAAWWWLAAAVNTFDSEGVTVAGCTISYPWPSLPSHLPARCYITYFPLGKKRGESLLYGICRGGDMATKTQFSASVTSSNLARKSPAAATKPPVMSMKVNRWNLDNPLPQSIKTGSLSLCRQSSWQIFCLSILMS